LAEVVSMLAGGNMADVHTVLRHLIFRKVLEVVPDGSIEYEHESVKIRANASMGGMGGRIPTLFLPPEMRHASKGMFERLSSKQQEMIQVASLLDLIFTVQRLFDILRRKGWEEYDVLQYAGQLVLDDIFEIAPREGIGKCAPLLPMRAVSSAERETDRLEQVRAV
jgi:hypothetical protein